ncbi:hypothetical protein [Dickeya fangzhongdai]|uniref:DUF4056 domain-containing protein n=1 Tax=Dickeya fangzhongdai TaxID=1778540 RepID=A0A2K8QUG0_9GAMM|nr:hypothetical protein [Dickeya fangzhongdai]ATZ96748.1 hypothetical protein CVE23_19035 [Dickeya fangzhongdai]QOH50187.1 hypothetical protein DYD82_19110 [Dickeya fangzhongdai]QOH54493.1 hypothetical protein DYD83_19110 [Dickeya fangzhongdai]WOX99170.1 hypothetical protein OGM22_16180 [Dickeya fangzhongdai]WOY05678.1 hypothetical protein OGM21_06245 [Dickeya fangzhongdai]
MSKRSDILNGSEATLKSYGLVYTEVLGWVDLGHAQGLDIKALMSQFEAGENGSQPYYDVKYFQGMWKFKKKVGISKYIVWRIKKGTTLYERYSIALAMMMKVAFRFENLQDSFPFSTITDSGFSGEDLVSDLLGFYRAIYNKNYFPELRPVSKESALKRWDFYGPIGSFKNKTFRPMLFPEPDKYPNSRPYWGFLPSFMLTIKPYSRFTSDKVGIAVEDGTEIHNNYFNGD